MRLLLFLLYPALELYLLVKVGSYTGALNMVLWVFASALIGIWAARSQGQEAMNKARAEIAAGRVPQNTFLDGLLLFFGGVLLILPGLISDAVGLFLLLPPCRRWAATALARYLTTHQAGAPGASRVIFFRSGPATGDPFANTPFGAGTRPGEGGTTRQTGGTLWQDAASLHEDGRPRRDGNATRQNGGTPWQDNGRAWQDEDAGPRQATIIESTAIDVTSPEDKADDTDGNGSGKRP